MGAGVRSDTHPSFFMALIHHPNHIRFNQENEIKKNPPLKDDGSGPNVFTTE